MNWLIKNLFCRWAGHRRGVRIKRPETEALTGIHTFRCPRCDDIWKRKARPAKATA